MGISKETIRRCIRDKRSEIEAANIIDRHFEYEENGNYVMVGVRHAGKSYMLYQRVRQLLAEGHLWDEILFVDFDDERLAEFQSEDFNSLIETHLETYGKKPYIFLDEVQNIPHWENFARRLANEKYHVYITGSNARMLSKDIATTLGGRYFIVDVYPYSFCEFLAAKEIRLDKDWEYSTLQRSQVIRLFDEYFHFGGLPEIPYFRMKRQLLSSLYQKIYLGDICQRNNIRNSKVLNIIIKKLAESVKQPISYNRLKNVVVSTGCQTTIPTVIDYSGYAEDSWLLISVGNELSKLADKESNKKYYFIDNGILNLFIVNDETSLLENLVAIHLCRTYGRENISYFNAGREIDFIVPEARLAVQVSYSIQEPSTYEREVTPLIKFADNHPDWSLTIVTYDETASINAGNSAIRVVPAWKWMTEETANSNIK